MSESPKSVSELIAAYIDGSLLPEEADELDFLVENDPQIEKHLIESVMAHLIITEKYSRDKNQSGSQIVETTLDHLTEFHVSPNESPDQNSCQKKANGPGLAEPVLSSAVINVEFDYRPLAKRYADWMNEAKEKPTSDPELKRRSSIPFIIRLVLFFGFFGWLAFQEGRDSADWIEEEIPTVAKIVEMVDVVWSDPTVNYKRGQDICPGPYIIKSGYIQFMTSNGSQMLVEGPANLVIRDAMSVFCSKGKISTIVSKNGIGFEISTPFGKVVDRGTEFFTEVTDTELSVGVKKGKVDMIAGLDKRTSLRAGKAMRIDNTQKTSSFRFDPAHFLESRIFDGLVDRYVTKQMEKQSQAQLQLDDNPNLLARFDFDQARHSTIQNSSAVGRRNIPFATYRGTSAGKGPLKGLSSLEVNTGNAMVEMNLPVSLQSMTLMAYVRFDRHKREGNVLFASESFREKNGTILWQILSNGAIQLQYRESSSKVDYVVSGPILTRSSWGTWVRLTLVMNAHTRRISFYLDGKRVFSGPWKQSGPIQLGHCTFGNTSQNVNYSSNRCFGGALGEFSLYKTPLTESEIKTIFDRISE